MLGAALDPVGPGAGVQPEAVITNRSAVAWSLRLPAGLALRLEGPPTLAARVARRFPSWAVGPGSDAPLRLRLRTPAGEAAGPALPPSPSPAVAPLLPTIRLAGPRLRLEGPGLSGEADLRRGEACLDLRGGDAAAQVDYTLRVLTALLVEARGGLLLHGAGLVRDGRGLLLLGPSGTGKTTAARNAGGAQVLNDDLVLLLPEPDGTWQLHASPFTNPSQVQPAGPAAAPLAAILRLRQSPRVHLEPLSEAAALAELLAAVPVLVADGDRLPGLVDRLRAVLRRSPAMTLGLRPDAGYWSLLDPWLAGLGLPAASSQGGPVS